jgi:hypothetical protein
LLKSSDKDLLLEIDDSLLSKSADNIGSVEKIISDIITESLFLSGSQC